MLIYEIFFNFTEKMPQLIYFYVYLHVFILIFLLNSGHMLINIHLMHPWYSRINLDIILCYKVKIKYSVDLH